ncbi:ubiquinol-cytochrome c reductase iron-sulfur subunit [Marinibactrum halimedae]|uniref:Ubiquinol-cytochrome c reductase iron-sulfur subunit n=1 Tax=Marinibactrum halimedae TaxID=1444977 RepID=A0AA37T7P8_9GAMM|nr:ubiquinol-cytochrome c reductase iron-sulfur subunit [Marinibactrum halimedae]MCD9457540.1 ubiquinol-cytochrome c reductase iron-sulfur subunit [Marinibactrum halimedae]GLS25406.1 ubiquinol-cytochrome c reductase iron-sulfur subunit [Marinibactrum halimedae]
MSNDGVNNGRRRFLTAATSAVGAVGAVGAAIPFVGSWNPSAKAKAAGAPVKANVSKLEPGQMITVEWRGKPVYIVRRTTEVLEGIRKMDGEVRDPQSEEPQQPEYVNKEFRSIKDEFLVLLGLCTHLGCAPMYRPEVGAADLGGAKWQGGFFCPCHGSKFDLAGRVLKGVPAPINLEVPPHSYEGDYLITIGVDQEA